MRIGRYQSSDSNNIGTAVTFLLIGLGAGALAGLLLAPKTGKQMRRDLQRGLEDAKDTLGDWADEAKERVRDARPGAVFSVQYRWKSTCTAICVATGWPLSVAGRKRQRFTASIAFSSKPIPRLCRTRIS